MRAAGTPPAHVAGRGQDGGLQLHRGVVQSRPSPFWHPLSIPNRLRDADAQGDQNDLSDKPSTKPGQLHWLLGAVVLLANWPYTIFVIMPTNRRLMDTPVEAAAAETRRMIRWWGVLHAGRSALGLVATLIFLWAQR